MGTMYREERLRQILQLIQTERKVNVRELAGMFSCSTSSIRLDLTELETRGLIQRTHGGAILADGVEQDLVLDKQMLQQRLLTHDSAKQSIGAATAAMIGNGDSILIDGGSTTFYVAKALGACSGLTIITTSIQLYPTLNAIPDARLYLTGGLVHPQHLDLTGDISLDSIRRFSPDHTIIGIDGVTLKTGLTSTEPSVATLKREMIDRSRNLIVVADSTKYGMRCLTHVADITPDMTLVTDNGLTEDYRQSFVDAGLNLHVAEPL